MSDMFQAISAYEVLAKKGCCRMDEKREEATKKRKITIRKKAKARMNRMEMGEDALSALQDNVRI